MESEGARADTKDPWSRFDEAAAAAIGSEKPPLLGYREELADVSEPPRCSRHVGVALATFVAGVVAVTAAAVLGIEFGVVRSLSPRIWPFRRVRRR